MKIPKKIQIAGKTIDIARDDNYLASNGLIGESRADQDIITVPTEKTHFSKQCIEQTLIHECVHKINAILSLGSPFNDESYVNPLSEMLYQVFKQIEGSK